METFIILGKSRVPILAFSSPLIWTIISYLSVPQDQLTCKEKQSDKMEERSSSYFKTMSFHMYSLDVPTDFRLVVMLQLDPCGLHHDRAMPVQASAELPSQ